jgi:prophage tail gpP-like protein
VSGNRGWICPVCGRGNAPFVVDCACHREGKAKQADAKQPNEKVEREFIEKMREQTLSDSNDVIRQYRLTDCPRCWQHGFNRTHGLMEVCPYTGQR